MKKIQLFLLQGLLSSVPLYTLTAQTTTPSTHYAVETGIVAGHGDYSPFWFTANRQGLSSVKTENDICAPEFSIHRHWVDILHGKPDWI